MILGTINNCAYGYTPWGTYLTCEENFNGYFVNASGSIPPDQPPVRHQRPKVSATAGRNSTSASMPAKHPNEPNRFGWVVEIDPWDPTSTPVKRTALGRNKHEGATVALATDNRVVVYMGDDERFEYIYKFISTGRYQPGDRGPPIATCSTRVRSMWRGSAPTARGDWLPLCSGKGPLTEAGGFTSQADVLIRARSAGDAIGRDQNGSAGVDRGLAAQFQDVFCTLTNNASAAAKDRPGTDAANPRARQCVRPDPALERRRRRSGVPTFRAGAASPNAAIRRSRTQNKRGKLKGDALRQSRWAVDRSARPPLDPDRHLDLGVAQGRLRQYRQQL